MPDANETAPTKPCPVPELAILLPDGRKVRLSRDVVERERIEAGTLTPFTRLPIVLLDEAEQP